MTFKVTWTKPDGSRDGFESASAKDTVREIAERGVVEAPGLRVKDGGGVALTWQALVVLAAQQGAG